MEYFVLLIDLAIPLYIIHLLQLSRSQSATQYFANEYNNMFTAFRQLELDNTRLKEKNDELLQMLDSAERELGVGRLKRE
jgi:hypothetical protein